MWIPENGYCSEIIQGQGGVDAIACTFETATGIRALNCQAEVVVEDVSGRPLVVFSEVLHDLSTHLCDQKFAGCSGDRLHTLQFEGRAADCSRRSRFPHHFTQGRYHYSPAFPNGL